MYTVCVGFCNICSVYICVYIYVVNMQYLGLCRPVMPIVPVMYVHVHVSNTHKNTRKPITSTVYNF